MASSPYMQKKCPYCGQPFTEQDDVVVCPECGTPHHRTCWQQHGVCAHADLHGKSAETAAPTESPTEQPSEKAEKCCPRCGYRNAANAAFCSGCGFSFNGMNTPFHIPTQQFDPTVFDPSINFSNESDFEDVPAADVARMVGANTAYYMPVFARIRAKSGSRFHFCALLFGGGWMLYRKQYKTGSIVLAVQVLLKALQYWALYAVYLPILQTIMTAAGIDVYAATTITNEQMAALSQQIMQLPLSDLARMLLPAVFWFAALIFSIVIGCNANRWYYRHTVNTARRIRTKYSDSEEMRVENETRCGGINRPLGISLMLCGMILYLSMDQIIVAILRWIS